MKRFAEGVARFYAAEIALALATPASPLDAEAQRNGVRARHQGEPGATAVESAEPTPRRRLLIPGKLSRGAEGF